MYASSEFSWITKFATWCELAELYCPNSTNWCQNLCEGTNDDFSGARVQTFLAFLCSGILFKTNFFNVVNIQSCKWMGALTVWNVMALAHTLQKNVQTKLSQILWSNPNPKIWNTRNWFWKYFKNNVAKKTVFWRAIYVCKLPLFAFLGFILPASLQMKKTFLYRGPRDKCLW